ncbi:flagellar hook-basal body complex protein FliE [Novosphingobium sp. BL-52-GroH]|uniref:flagellar hook-basal body complex protein FliE n=1 Tax=Novosphingobium sp. BL-52-GroH TaxID=3349877 RepID=UPI00384DDA6A
MSIGALDAASAYGRAMRGTSPLAGGAQGIAGAGAPAGGSAGLTGGPIGPGLASGISGGLAGGLAPAATDGTSFGGMIESMVSQTAGSLRNAETQSVKQIGGKGDLIDVATAIGAAETALDTVVAVRDRVVSAYSEIMRMQI